MVNKDEWNLNEIFKNDDELESAIKELYSLIEKIKQSKGKLGNSVDEVAKCYKNLENALELHEKIYGYAMLKYHQNMSNQDSIKLYKRIETLTTEFSEAESFISPEMSKLDDSKLEEYLKDDRVNEYEKTIRDIIKGKKHILSE